MHNIPPESRHIACGRLIVFWLIIIAIALWR